MIIRSSSNQLQAPLGAVELVVSVNIVPWTRLTWADARTASAHRIATINATLVFLERLHV